MMISPTRNRGRLPTRISLDWEPSDARYLRLNPHCEKHAQSSIPDAHSLRLIARDLLHEIEEGAHLGGRQVTRWVIGVERIALLRPVRQDLNELPALEPGVEAYPEALEHALPGGTGRYRRRR